VATGVVLIFLGLAVLIRAVRGDLAKVIRGGPSTSDVDEWGGDWSGDGFSGGGGGDFDEEGDPLEEDLAESSYPGEGWLG
jgi:hypothetical protein